jgi:hypothetical protein
MATVQKFKAFRFKVTGEWYYPVDGEKEWGTSSMPFLLGAGTTIETYKELVKMGHASMPDENEDNIELVSITLMLEENVADVLSEFENKLEEEATLISEAVQDVITISKMNDEESARELIRKQFVVINRQDTQIEKK